MKKRIIIFLATFILVLHSFSPVLYASHDSDEIEFEKDGTLTFTTTDTKASTTTKYRTVGFTLFNQDRTKSVVLQLEESSSKDLEDGNIETTFITDRDTIFERISEVDEKWKDELCLNGGKVILDGIFTVVSNGTMLGGLTDYGRQDWGEIHYTLSDIKYARSWADPDSLDQYFDKELNFPPQLDMVEGKAYMKHFTDKGTPLEGYDMEQVLKKDSSYQFINTQINGYEFLGSKISYDNPPTGEMGSNNHYTLSYTGEYKDAYIYFYYQYKSPEIKPSQGSAVIAHNRKNASVFDVKQGVPTGENLYVNVSTNEYIADFELDLVSGVHKYTTRDYKGLDENGEKIYEKTTHKIPYSYYKIESLQVYGLDHAVITNDAFPGGTTTVLPNPVYYSDPKVEFDQNGGVDADGSRVTVWNDKLVINGKVILDNREVSRSAPSPKQLTIPLIHEDALYKEGIQIDPIRANKAGIPSTTTVYYTYQTGTGGSGTKAVNIPTNHVTVHTPVFCDGGIKNDIEYNQELKPDPSRASLILDRVGTIKIETKGQHKNIPGYGNRDFKDYTQKKQVRFPFDLYIDTNYKEASKFLPKNTWWDMKPEAQEVSFYLPSWVKEGDYTIEYRSLALNAKDGQEKTQERANIDLNNYIARDQSLVRVIGRIYDFKITDVENYPLWEEVFRVEKDSLTRSGNYYYVGDKDQNGNMRGNNSPFTLPLLPGSHPTIKNEGSLATGYTFKFELKTMGNYSGDKDCIEILPTFLYVSRDGKKKQEVDLYYSENFGGKDNHFIRVGSEPDKENMKYIYLKDADRSVPEKEIKDTAEALSMNETDFLSQKAKLGWYDRIILAKPLRTFIGDSEEVPRSVAQKDVKKSIQKWYGEYNLPNHLYVAPKGYKVKEYGLSNYGLDNKEDFWLKDGYIIVNFDIKTIKNGDFTKGVLSYHKAPHCNMWQVEGFNLKKTDYQSNLFTLNHGDIVFYETDHKSSDDYRSGGTH